LFEGILLFFLISGPIASNSEIVLLPSVHEQAVLENPDMNQIVSTIDISEDAVLYKTVFGFLPYWVNQAYLQYDLINVLAVFGVEMGSSGTITNAHGFPATFATAMDQAHAHDAVVVVTVTNFSGSSIHSILTTSKTTAISTIVNLVENSVVDGVCIDFENVQSADAANLVYFMEDLRIALPDAHISICTPVVDWGGAFNYASLAESCDALMMMCYAFAGSWNSVAGPNAPLVGWGSSPESSSNMAWAMCDYVRYAPEVHEKLVVGLPYYGHEWETTSSEPHSPVTDCVTLFYNTLISRAESYGELWDTESFTPWYNYYTSTWNQGWYDDDESLALKYEMVNMSGMQGVGIWALGYDGSRTELWDLLASSFGQPVSNDMITDNLEDSFLLHGPASYWHPYTEDGLYHTFFYTGSISSGPDVSWAEWNFDLPDSSGNYELEVFIPPSGTATVTYHIFHSTTEDSVMINQASFPGQWVALGGPFNASDGLTVTIGDNTGESGERIVVDAVRFTQLTGIENDPTGAFTQPLFSVSCSPSSSFSISTYSGGTLRILDITGRIVDQNAVIAGESISWNGNGHSGVYFICMDVNDVSYIESVVLIK